MGKAGSQTKKFTIVTSNIYNYKSNRVYLQQLLKHYDIVCIQEHWMFNFEKKVLSEASSSHVCFAKSVDDEDPISPKQRPRGYGGLAIYIPTKWAAEVRFANGSDHQLCAVTIDLPGCHICIINCYLPCRGYRTSANMYGEALDQLREFIIKYSLAYTVIVCGDLNTLSQSGCPNRGCP